GQPAGSEAPSRLTIAVRQDFGPLNIFASHEEGLTELVYDKLLAPSPYVSEPQPWLATQVVAVDPSTWEVTLRDDVSWHDGVRFTASDVVFTVEYFKRAPTGRWTHHVSEVPQISQVEVVDPTRVRVRCAHPCPELGRITLADLPILPRHVWDGVAQPRQFTGLPIGTGPYRLVDYSPTSGYRFEANEQYFAGAPRIRELLMPVIPDPSTTFTALRTGEIDAADRPVPPELLDELRATPGIELITTAPLQFPELRLNFQRPVFANHEVRRALALAVDREALLRIVALGQGRPATKGYPHPDSPWTNPNLHTPHDPAAARAILDGAGFVDRNGDGIREAPDGTPLAFSIQVTATEPVEVRAAELLAEQFRALGALATVQPVDAGTIDSLFRSRQFDAYVNVITAHGVADPTQFIMSHRSGYLWDAPEIPYPAWDSLYERWRQAATLDERTKILFEMQELFNRQPTAIPLYYPEVSYAVRPASYDGWVTSPGYGIVHKWSFLPEDVSRTAHAVQAE
ncbi:MAG: ABC transporter substrate-binding protein, partial [Actinomycetota bacterium]|nr:ABC transporter substrate-binding protein [Actinomycetota bacterium]